VTAPRSKADFEQIERALDQLCAELQRLIRASRDLIGEVKDGIGEGLDREAVPDADEFDRWWRGTASSARKTAR
jgi:hypothetical protein